MTDPQTVQAVIKVFILTTLAFLIASAWMPFLLRLLQRAKMGKSIRNTGDTPVFSKLHASKAGTPTMGGALVWVTALVLAIGFSLLGRFTNAPLFDQLNFLTRQETLLPLGVLFATALVGLVDDWLNVRRIGASSGGFRIRYRLVMYSVIALVGAAWFYFKLDWDVLHIPFWGNVNLGWWYIGAFFLVIVSTAFSVNEIDGLDGLAGGTLLTALGAYAAIAFVAGKVNLASFLGVLIGALLAFLWYNIHPAKFFMGDTGAMSLGITLGVVAMLTNQPLLLPIIGLMFVIESLSVIVQHVSKFWFGKKVFLSSPIHHHLEAIGWKESQIVMRFWVISGVAAVVGVILALLDTTL